MKKSSKIFLIFLMTVSCSGVFAENSSEKYFSVEIRQDEKLKEIRNDELILDRKGFDLILNLNERACQGVLVNVFTNDKAFKVFQSGQSWDQAFDIPGFFMGMAEYDLNPEKNLILRDTAAHYLYYDSPEDNRFNYTAKDKKSGWVKGVRTVENLVIYPYPNDEGRKVLAVQDIPFKDLYLVFFLADWTEDYQRKELQRYQLHIKFK